MRVAEDLIAKQVLANRQRILERPKADRARFREVRGAPHLWRRRGDVERVVH